MDDAFLTFYADPGEDFGWCIGHNHRLVARGILKMWETADELADKIESEVGAFAYAEDNPWLCDGVDPELLKLPIGRIVCEDFRIYPWKIKALKFNPVRTARVIGALTFIARRHGIDFVLQPAAIKDTSLKGGAAELFDTPLHENRHSNDAIMHFVFYTQVTAQGRTMPVPNEGVQGKDDGGVD
jgi:hypothetical protein